jgi:hypothetical protein
MRGLLLSSAVVLLAGATGLSGAVAAAPGPVVGAYQSVDVGSAEVLDARTAVQTDLARLRIEAIHAAYAQVVAGINFKLVCQVSDGDGSSTWVFIVWHRLDGQWQFESATRL